MNLKTLFRAAILSLFISISALASAVASDDIDKVPSWYNGQKPWNSINREGREEILNIRRKYEADTRKAQQPSIKSEPGNLVINGEKLIKSIHEKYKIHSFYSEPGRFGSRMVIWLPEEAWAKLSNEEKISIEAYMKSKYANWGIGIGRVDGVDILADRLVVEN